MQQRVKSIKKKLEEHLNQGNETGLRNLFEISHPSDLAAVFEVIERDTASELFLSMSQEKQLQILREI
ncbi:MAG: hypothetical protein ABEK50_09165, partial [bacterium]